MVLIKKTCTSSSDLTEPTEPGLILGAHLLVWLINITSLTHFLIRCLAKVHPFVDLVEIICSRCLSRLFNLFMFAITVLLKGWS